MKQTNKFVNWVFETKYNKQTKLQKDKNKRKTKQKNQQNIIKTDGWIFVKLMMMRDDDEEKYSLYFVETEWIFDKSFWIETVSVNKNNKVELKQNLEKKF